MLTLISSIDAAGQSILTIEPKFAIYKTEDFQKCSEEVYNFQHPDKNVNIHYIPDINTTRPKDEINNWWQFLSNSEIL